MDEAKVELRDATQIPLAEMALVHVDPDRRAHGRRTTKLAYHEPAEEYLKSLIDQCEGGAIKLAPGTDIPPW